jgi:uncharacterized protein (UPF0332 family)
VAAAPEDFLAQAVKLLASASADPDYRTVIDRAYYGAFNAARQFEEHLPYGSQAAKAEKAGSHEWLFQRLERPDRQLDYVLSVISKDIAAQLRQLKPLREIASYELGETVRVDQAEEAVQAAKDIMAECAKGRKKLSP